PRVLVSVIHSCQSFRRPTAGKDTLTTDCGGIVNPPSPRLRWARLLARPVSPLEISDKQVRVGGLRRMPVGREDQFRAVRREHRKAVECLAESDLLEPCAVDVDQ